MSTEIYWSGDTSDTRSSSCLYHHIEIYLFIIENADRKKNKQGLAFLDLLSRKGKIYVT